VVVNGVARIFFGDLQYGSHCSLKRIDPLDQHYSYRRAADHHRADRVENGIQTISLTGDELRTYFTVNEDLELVGEDGFTFLVTGEDSQMLPTEAFQALYAQTPFAVRLLGALGSGILLVLAILLVRWFTRTIAGQGLFSKLIFCVLFGGLFAATLMTIFYRLLESILSESGRISYPVGGKLLFFTFHAAGYAGSGHHRFLCHLRNHQAQ